MEVLVLVDKICWCQDKPDTVREQRRHMHKYSEVHQIAESYYYIAGRVHQLKRRNALQTSCG